MKQNNSFILKEIAGVPYLLPYGQMIADHQRGLKTNATGVYLWNLLEQGLSLDEVIASAADYYEIPADALPDFKEDITAFLTQLCSYGIMEDAPRTVPNTDTVIKRLTASRKAFAGETYNSAPNCQKYISIGGLILSYTGPAEAFPPEFQDFLTENPETLHQEITLHPTLPQEETGGQALLQNFELNILEQEHQYILHFPTAKKHLEIHLSKDGHNAHCYSLPPYTADFHYDFFHALRLVYLFLAQKSGMTALHSASILYKDKLWLFSGHSGMGKSTHTNLWKEHFGTPVINGDLNLLAMENGKPVVHGIPWCGTSQIYDTKTYPLGGIILINRGKENYTEELSTDQKQLLVSQRLISPSWTKEQWENNFEVAEKVTEDILVCKLFCTKEKEAAEVMKGRIDHCMQYTSY